MRRQTTERGSGGLWLWRSLGLFLMVASGLATVGMITWTAVALSKQSGPLIGPPDKHNELIGGHGNDTIRAGNLGDVIWGDYKPCCQPTTQVDRLYGGPGNDRIYASHGINYIRTGGGRDFVHAHVGRGGHIYCESRQVHLYMSHLSYVRYRLHGCQRRNLDFRPERVRRR
jgi:Ca2+-binding RTX toxin-like protein